MEDLILIVTVTLVHLLALISPGPDFFLACRNSIQYSSTIGMWTAVGFGMGVAIHISYTLFGLTWASAQSNFLLDLIKYLGAIYLIYLGISSIFSKRTLIQTTTEHTPHLIINRFVAIRMGFLTNLLNPKATLFFLSLFTIIIGPEVKLSVIILLSFILVSSTIIWFSWVAIFLDQQKIRNLIEAYQLEFNRFFGLLLIVIGIRIGWF
ncbi:MAG: LysE family transporter [Flavobacteriaceae bacterium]|nr:LysE family transporter [Flavobacteriaceae bacterium]MDG1965108.1 LysE family transporter [Flavobacteriaceae bacterium]